MTVERFILLMMRYVIARVERITEAPIMKQRINAGSDAYFTWEDEHAGESALDDILDPSQLRG